MLNIYILCSSSDRGYREGLPQYNGSPSNTREVFL